MPPSYTPFYTVGDLVGLLDALQVETATVVGHDSGARVAWSAAMMRPDRFTAMFGISVPFLPPGGKSLLRQLREAGKDEFYMFRQMCPEADSKWADAATTIPGMLYWTSGSAPDDQRWEPFDRLAARHALLLSASQTGLTQMTSRRQSSIFSRRAFMDPSNYYRAIQPFFDMAGACAGATIRQPSFFLMGKADGIAKVRAITEDGLRLSLPGLRGFVALDGVGH